MMPQISIVDQPVESKRGEDGKVVPRSMLSEADDPDRLGTGIYATSLARFIEQCETPMTIGVQGEWGSGKTSLLNMICEEIEAQERQHNKTTICGSEEYKTIWVNTWEHSLMKTPEECLLSIVEEIIEEISSTDGSYKSAERAKRALAGLARGALKIGASVAFGGAGEQAASEMLSGDGSNRVKVLRRSLADIIDKIVKRNENKIKRFVVFIDDLDRLEPSVAVLVLELLKNIFTVNHCVFVLAIDYQVVVKGLKGKFGEPTEKNEWEFRAFFDKIIQLPFMMPMASYNLRKYIDTNLLDIEYFSKSEAKTLLADGRLARVASLSLGHNPRSVKRLLNALSLIKLHNNDLSDARLKQLVFALVCCQISFSRVFDLLLSRPDFLNWDDEFVDKMTSGLEEDKHASQALNSAMQVNSEDFDEKWEQVLFIIIWQRGWDRNQLPKMSRLLSEIKDKILGGLEDVEFNSYMKRGLLMTAVTAVAATDVGFFSGNSDEESDTDSILNRVQYWERFSKAMAGTSCAFDPKVTKIRATHSTASLHRRSENSTLDFLEFVMSVRPTKPLRMISVTGEGDDAINFFKLLKQVRSDIEVITDSKLTFKIGTDRSTQMIHFEPTKQHNISGTLDLPENKQVADEVFQWLKETQPKLESYLAQLITNQIRLDDI